MKQNSGREQAAARQSKILDEAIRLIGETGYSGCTLSALALRCGLSKPGLLHHFGSKEILLLAVLEEVRRRSTDILEPLMTAAASTDSEQAARESLQALLDAMIAMSLKQPEIHRLETMVYCEAVNPDHPAHEFFCSADGLFVARMTPMLRPWTDQPKSVAIQLIAMFKGLGLRWMYGGKKNEFSKEWHRAIRALLPKLYAPE